MVNILVVYITRRPSWLMLVSGSELFASLISRSKNLCAKFGTKVVLVCGLVETKNKMGLSNFTTVAAELGVLPVLVMNTVLSLALLKNMVRSVLQVMMGVSSSGTSTNLEEDPHEYSTENATTNERRVSITQFKSFCHNNRSSNISGGAVVECCVCLCGFEAEEEVSELSCKHFFHKGCLDKWFNNKHSTCPLCRSIH